MSTPSTETPTAVDTQGDLRASHTAADAFNNFADTIESVVAAALGQNSPYAAQVFDETGESLVPVDTHALSNRVDGLSNLVNLMKGGISTAQSTADSAQNTADNAMSTAKQALNKASINQAIMDSDNETPPYVSNGGGPQ